MSDEFEIELVKVDSTTIVSRQVPKAPPVVPVERPQPKPTNKKA